jgi:dihydrofolate synthase/folylpolyglutamate synthase
LQDNLSDIENLLQDVSSPLICPGLSRMARLLAALGNPERNFPAVHVAGTNGKGSISAMLESVFLKAGYRTCLYTSPHLVDITERIRFCGVPSSSETFLSSAKEVCDAVRSNFGQSNRPTYFEVLTAAAFHAIANYAPDIAIVEAGMGGRLDATNIMKNVVMSVIASIGMDHSEFLGPDLRTIAMEKFLVLRPGGKSIFSGGNIELESRFQQLCERISNKGVIASREARIKDPETGIDSNSFSLTTKEGELGRFTTSLGGIFQFENARTAILAALALAERFPNIDLAAVRNGLLATDWPGRLEKVSFRGRELILDGGHNLEGVSGTTETLLLCGYSSNCAVVFAAMKDKDLKGMIDKIVRNFPFVVFTSVPGTARSANPRILLDMARAMKTGTLLEVEEEPMKAIEKASALAGRILCCGSLFLVGEVKKQIRG